MINGTEKYNLEFRQYLAKSLPNQDSLTKVANIIGKNFDSAEEAYFNALSGETDQAKILAAESNYQKAVRVFTGFQQVMKNSFQIMMEGIRGLSVR